MNPYRDLAKLAREGRVNQPNLPNMQFSRACWLVSRLAAFWVLPLALAQEEPAVPQTVFLANPQGASIALTQMDTGWRWTWLTVPGAPDGGWVVSDRSVEVTTPAQTAALSRGWSLMEATPDRVVLEQDVPSAGLRFRRIFMFGTAGNVLRIETWVRSIEGKVTVSRIGLLEARIGDELFRETGAAPASFPLFGETVFAGIEHVSGEAHMAGEAIQLSHRPHVTVEEGWQALAPVVVGWMSPERMAGLRPEQRMRAAFLQYLDSVRVKPERMVLHSETWWTLPPPLSEKDVLADIEKLKKAFLDRTGMFFDTYALDLGWSNPRSFWSIDPERFPNEFRTVNEKLGGLGARLGLWMSPGSGYADGLDNAWLSSQGYEMTPFEGYPSGVACFALGGRYQREFKEKVVAYAQQYGLGHVILDFLYHGCDVEAHGHGTGVDAIYAIHAGVADVLDGLRAVNPNIALEPMVCGYPPSPWWLMKTPFILGPAGDDMPYGRVPSPDWMESLISARDIAYRAGQESWIMPTQALETWDIIVQTPGAFENVAVMAIGRGRWFVSSYIKPELMKPEDWDFFAALIRWARYNKQYLSNAWLFGGKPEDREAYGYQFRNEGKDIYCVRNPWMEERAIELPTLTTRTEARELRMIYPRRATLARIEPGAEVPPVILAPYETAVIETVPATDAPQIAPLSVGPRVEAEGAAVRFQPGTAIPAGENPVRQYFWGAMVALDAAAPAELCVLVEGTGDVNWASCRISIDGRDLVARESASAGQFAAATEVYPENWKWFIVPLPPGQTSVQVDVSVQSEQTSIGVFVRGTAAALNAAAPEDDSPVFPVFNPERRAWSKTLVPLATYPEGG